MEKIVNINGNELKVKVIDKKLKNTLVCIHGFSSSNDFIGNLSQHLDNFNIIAISYENLANLRMASISSTIITFFNDYLKRTNIYVLGHSLGGFFAAQIGALEKVQGVYMLNPVHPLLWDSNPFVKLKKIISVKSKITRATLNIVIKMIKTRNPRLVKFVDPESSWFAVTIDLVDQEEQLKSNLIANYEQMKNKATFLVSKVDNIIASEKLLPYLKEKGYHYHELNFEGHSPLFQNSEKVVPYLLNIKRKRRWTFWRKLL